MEETTSLKLCLDIFFWMLQNTRSDRLKKSAQLKLKTLYPYFYLCGCYNLDMSPSHNAQPWTVTMLFWTCGQMYWLLYMFSGEAGLQFQRQIVLAELTIMTFSSSAYVK